MADFSSSLILNYDVTRSQEFVKLHPITLGRIQMPTCFSKPLFAIMAALSLAGCGRTLEPVVSITTHVRAKTALLSELQQAEDLSKVIECPIFVKNSSNKSQSLLLLNTGCTCYGVTLDGKRLERGQSIEIPAQTRLKFNIDAQAPLAEAAQEYRAIFVLPVDENRRLQQDVLCQLNVYRDLKVFPSLLTCETRLGEADVFERELQVERIYRGNEGISPDPAISVLPEGVRVISIKKSGAAEEIESGIWKTNWVVRLAIDVDSDMPPQGIADQLSVAVGNEGDSASPAFESIKLIRRPKLAIQFPQRIHFGKVDGATERKRILFLTSNDETPFRIVAPQSETQSPVSVLVPEEASTRCKVELIFRGEIENDWTDTLVLQTNVPEQPEIRIQLSATSADTEN